LLLLVCYHDLVGDVLGQGRDPQQILDVVRNEDELRMLFAISRADVTALVPRWWDQNQADELYTWFAEKIDEDAE
jgi:UTP:GlnB (protein PII) uridylyltransferase